MNLLAILLISTLTFSASNGCNSVQTESGECCYFPFIYAGQTYYECINDNRRQQWCSLTYNYDQDGQWCYCGNCTTIQTEEGGCCYFPFVYNDQTYHQCTSDGWTQPRCSLTVNFNQDDQWGNCADNPATTTSPHSPPTTPDNLTTTTTSPPPPTTPDNPTTATTTTLTPTTSDNPTTTTTPPPPPTTTDNPTTATTTTLTPTTPGSSCGSRPTGTRIMGGTQAQKDSWPWQALLAEPKSRRPFCGGSLIDEKWVLTAAHCVDGYRLSEIVVRMGAYKRTDIGQQLEVRKIIMHERYDPDTYHYDIALLKLKTQATLGTGVGLVCLPELSFSLADKTCYITGWGATSKGESRATFLQEASVPIIPPWQCKIYYPGKIHGSMICSGFEAGGVNSCKGDDGGPLVCEFDGKWYLEGATSWGEGCGRRRRPSVYAWVRRLKKWIERNMSSN